MKKLTIAFLVILFIGSTGEVYSSWSFELESGLVFGGYNNVRIPRESGTKISLTDDLRFETSPFVRVRLNYLWKKRHTLSLLIAPLNVESNGKVDRAVVFEDVEFPANEYLVARYKFNSYRLTYRYEIYRKNDLSAGLGLTAKIRDAAVRLESGTLVSEKTDLGFVPLVNFRLCLPLFHRAFVILEGDALAAPQGRAEDVSLAMAYKVHKRVIVKAGYRLLEGGADVPEVYNFALFHYLWAGISASF
jgi:hypothetical protein